VVGPQLVKRRPQTVRFDAQLLRRSAHEAVAPPGWRAAGHSSLGPQLLERRLHLACVEAELLSQRAREAGPAIAIAALVVGTQSVERRRDLGGR